jgi:hypothetical protein
MPPFLLDAGGPESPPHARGVAWRVVACGVELELDKARYEPSG